MRSSVVMQRRDEVMSKDTNHNLDTKPESLRPTIQIPSPNSLATIVDQQYHSNHHHKPDTEGNLLDMCDDRGVNDFDEAIVFSHPIGYRGRPRCNDKGYGEEDRGAFLLVG